MTKTTGSSSAPELGGFVRLVAAHGRELYRDFPWRQTRDPYAVLVSEVMLQQTQVTRVVAYYERWLADFPTIDALAAAPLEAVLRAWQGLGYNRRAVALKRLADGLAEATAPGRQPCLPRERDALLALPGVGPATAAGVRAFAWGEPDAYLETNVRAVFLHELFADRDGVPDREIAPLVARAAHAAVEEGIDARTWNYALLDYGAHLKRSVPNPSRRSSHHTRQSPFEGSRRQRRARLLRLVMDMPGANASDLAEALGVTESETRELLESLRDEGFMTDAGGTWNIG